ncbi:MULTISPECIES: hypothetical protein [Loigolactobacillus]|uniref:Uncharacterized protein n=1 Tax=Loigolactobacillus backii TaxID=375175 RepID=A0A192H2H9_9LACO|nr:MULTISPECIES: hypothetical protein [Loigolactobacillus]ANK58890.1 hypothetical protein AYR52_00580 [Loigolactobacillus backii]ANK58945.1 hypothetical protein AYR52_00875 [Loigolactobacillus backii]ANK59045.1 hypothetical protein AYR52_01445 [Loigolactobacillus backii]ANK59345.1 hypothetical protein AYR52_03230 [Loigolactobacillus backii]ANK59391.1 hypothetical protein AYR52_03495 [Loigolactobacillus backii]
MDKPDIVQIKMDHSGSQSRSTMATKALQIRVDANKSVVVYNRINNYILEAVLKAVFAGDN